MSSQTFKISTSLIKSFTQMVNAQNASRYSYIQMLQDQYGQFLLEESKTPHYCDICKITILGKAIGPHKKSHYKRQEQNRGAILQQNVEDNQQNTIQKITDKLKK